MPTIETKVEALKEFVIFLEFNLLLTPFVTFNISDQTFKKCYICSL